MLEKFCQKYSKVRSFLKIKLKRLPFKNNLTFLLNVEAIWQEFHVETNVVFSQFQFLDF